MITRKNLPVAKRTFETIKTVDHQGKSLKLKQWITKPLDYPDKDILLTEDDLSFMPTQDNLKTFTYWATKDVHDKLFKSLYDLREVSPSGKIVKTTNVLNLLPQ